MLANLASAAQARELGLGSTCSRTRSRQHMLASLTSTVQARELGPGSTDSRTWPRQHRLETLASASTTWSRIWRQTAGDLGVSGCVSTIDSRIWHQRHKLRQHNMPANLVSAPQSVSAQQTRDLEVSNCASTANCVNTINSRIWRQHRKLRPHNRLATIRTANCVNTT